MGVCINLIQVILLFIHQSAILTGNKGIYVGDRGFDRGKIISDMIENDISFIFRGDERNLLIKGRNLSYKEIAKRTNYKAVSKNHTFKENIVEVGFKLPNSPDRKHQKKRIAKLYLVIANEKNRRYVYHLCHFRKDYSFEEIIQMAIQYCGIRWGTEEVHRYKGRHKKYYLEKMQLVLLLN